VRQLQREFESIDRLFVLVHATQQAGIVDADLHVAGIHLDGFLHPLARFAIVLALHREQQS
jgi:hypothetical protein